MKFLSKMRFVRILGAFFTLFLFSIPFLLTEGCDPGQKPSENKVQDSGTPENKPADRSVPEQKVADKATPKPLDPKKLGVREVCPGAVGCMNNKGQLEVAVATRSMTPEAYEVARFSYMKEEGFCPSPTPRSPHGVWRCGQLHELAQYSRKDCGLDGICPRDKIKTRISCKDNPCSNGLKCNDKDKMCYIHYDKPDADGSEKDGVQDWFLDCGRDRICPCLDPAGKPAYFGKGKKCLTGHKSNPAYKGADADGSEGNGKFDGVWMGGFGGNHPMQGKHDDIWARAIVLKTGLTTVAVVSVDLVGFFNNQVKLVRKLVHEQLKDKADIDYILISSTHGHEGPDTMGLWGRHESGVPAESGIQPKYIEFVRKQIAESILEAYKKLKPAKMYAARIQTGAKGFVRDSRDPVVIDDTLNVLQFVPIGQDKPIATLVNWGNHPETLSDTNNYVTSDFAHYLREGLEKGVPAKGSFKGLPAVPGVAIYLQAAVGGLMTQLRIEVPDVDGTIQNKNNWAKSRALGHQLVVKTHAALKTKEEIKNTAISLWSKEFLLTIDNRYYHIGFNLNLFKRKAEGYNPNLAIDKTNLPKVRSELGLIRVGAVTFFTMPGELDPEALIGGYKGEFSFNAPLVKPTNKNPPDLSKAPKGPYLKERIPGKYKLFVGLGNDQLGYILPTWNWQVHPNRPYLEQAKGDHYEETNSLGPQTLPFLMDMYKHLLKIATSNPPD